MKKLLLTCLLVSGASMSLSADVKIEPETGKEPEKSESKSEDSGGALGGLEVVSLLTLAGGAVYFTRKKNT